MARLLKESDSNTTIAKYLEELGACISVDANIKRADYVNTLFFKSVGVGFDYIYLLLLN